MNIKQTAFAAVLAMALMAVPALAVFDGSSVSPVLSSYAAPGDSAEEPYSIVLVEGDSWSYTPEYTISSGVTTTVSGSAASWPLTVSGGTISGTAPQVDGQSQVYDLTIKATSQQPYQEAFQYVEFTVWNTLAVSGTSSVDTFVGGSVNLTSQSNLSGVEWSISGAPAGITINESTGAVTGTVTGANQTYQATVTATHAASGQTDTYGIAFDVSASLQVTSEDIFYAVNGEALPSSSDDPNWYQLTSNISGVTYAIESIEGGSITEEQLGIQLAADGTFSGTPLLMDDISMVVTATETATGQSVDFDLTLHIAPDLAFVGLPTGGIIIG